MRVSPLATAASFLHSGLAAVRIFSLSFRILFRTGVIGSASSVVLKIFLILLFICPLLGGSLWLLHIVVCCLLIHLLKLSRSRYQSSNNVSVNPSAPCALCGNNEMSSFTEWLAAGASRLFFELFKGGCIVKLWAAMCFKRQCLSKVDNVEENEGSSLLDLPELALEAILSRLPASSLCQMAGVCKELRESCRSNHLWERLLEAKWGKIAGPAAHREWQSSVALNSDGSKVDQRNPRTWIWTLSCIWPFSLLNSQVNRKKITHDQPLDSLMAWYWALESGNFWFPAQVYNREHGHVGFMLSCYDAELSYDRRTNTFKARYPPHGPRTVVIEEGVQWERLRAPPVDTPTHELHVSDCLDDLQPGDHVEVQWRRNKEFPYGWWYGVVGHDDMCDRNLRHCHCHLNDTVWLEFNQYTLGSRWRRAAANRKTHREEGNEAEGFYGGIRKLQNQEEISTWKRLWPNETLE